MYIRANSPATIKKFVRYRNFSTWPSLSTITACVDEGARAHLRARMRNYSRVVSHFNNRLFKFLRYLPLFLLIIVIIAREENFASTNKNEYYKVRFTFQPEFSVI